MLMSANWSLFCSQMKPINSGGGKKNLKNSLRKTE